MNVENNPIVKQFDDAESVCVAAAEFFIQAAAESIAARGRFLVALSGGSSPKRIYQLLAQPACSERVDWSRVEFFWGDERSVPPQHQDSNYRMAYEAMLGPLQIPAAQIHRMPAEAEDLAAAARAYEDEIARVFGIEAGAAPPRFDLIMLGMGPDAHTASLFPHTAALNAGQRWVVENYVPKLSTHRMTLTADLINQGARILFTLAGEDKAGPLAEVLEGPEDSDRLPSQLVQPLDGELVWYLDRTAGSQLRCLKAG